MDYLSINIILQHCMLVLMIGLLHIASGGKCPSEMNYLTLEPDELVVKHGDSVQVNCSTLDFADGIQWLATEGSISKEYAQFVVWKVDHLLSWDPQPQCNISINEKDWCSTKLTLIVYKFPDVVSISLLNHTGPVLEGTEYQLQCDILNVAPVQNLTVTWYKGNETIKTDSYSDQSKTPVDESSILTITPSREDDGALYRCEAQLNLGPEGPHPSAIDSYFNLTVLYKPVILKCPPSFAGEEHTFSLDMNICAADGNPRPHVQWYLQGRLLNSSELLTRRNSGEYVFTATNDHGTVNSTVNITVEYAPEFLSGEDTLELSEGGDESLVCSAEGNPPPKMEWTYDDAAGNVHVTTEGQQSKLYISAIKSRTSSIMCNATNMLGSTSQIITILLKMPATTPRTTVAVMVATTAKPKVSGGKCPSEMNHLTLEPDELVVKHGDSVQVNCSTLDFADGIQWVATEGSISEEYAQFVVWKVDHLLSWDPQPQCKLQFNETSWCSTKLTLIVYKLPDDVSISPLNHNGPMVEGTEYQLQCDILNVAPVQNLTVTWYRRNETIKTDSYSDQSKTPVNESSILTITPSREDDGALYRCEAQLNLGPEGPHPSAIDSDFNLTVLYKPVILKCPRSFAGEEHTFSLDMNICAADGNPRPHVQWYLQGRLLNSSELLTRRNSGEYVFTATNDHGTVDSTVKITVEYVPELICPVHYEGEEGKNHNLTCSAGGMPAPTIIWSKDGKEIHLPVRLTRKESGEYNVSAINKHGTSYRKMDVNILYAPEFLSGEDMLELSEGGDESLVCSAEGNPPPKMEWTYDDAAGNVHVTTEGRKSTVRITGATSTNTGSYICTATNRVGTKTKMITVTMKVPSSDTWYYIAIISFIIISLIIIIWCLKHHSKKQGRYRFTPIPLDSCQATGQQTQSTDLPLNTLSQKANGSH